MNEIDYLKDEIKRLRVLNFQYIEHAHRLWNLIRVAVDIPAHDDESWEAWRKKAAKEIPGWANHWSKHEAVKEQKNGKGNN